MLTPIKQIILTVKFLSPLWIQRMFLRLNKPLLHAWVGDKSLHPAPTGYVINHTSTDARTDWTVALVLCDTASAPWFRFQVYMSTKRVTDVHCANDTHVIFETSLWQFGERLRPCACQCWPGLLPRYTPHCALKRLRTPHPFTHQQTKCSVLHVWLAHGLLFMLNRGGGKDPRQDVPFIDMFMYVYSGLLGSVNPALVLERVQL